MTLDDVKKKERNLMGLDYNGTEEVATKLAGDLFEASYNSNPNIYWAKSFSELGMKGKVEWITFAKYILKRSILFSLKEEGEDDVKV